MAAGVDEDEERGLGQRLGLTLSWRTGGQIERVKKPSIW